MSMAFTDVSNILWQERHLLDLLRFKLEEQQLLLAAGRSQWLTLAGAEVERVLDEMRHVELLRAIEVDALAGDLGLGPNASLAELALRSPEPWASILAQHRAALLSLSSQVRELADANREMLRHGAAAVRELFETLETSGADGYGADGSRVTHRPSSVLLDQVV